jgi:uncharacterized protein (DUF1501 family)
LRRKDFLQLSALGALGVGLGKGLNSCGVSPSYTPWKGKRIVLVQLRGGHDGLFAMPFAGSDVISKERPQLQVSAQKNSIELENGWHWNEMLQKLLPLWESGDLIAIPNVGYDQPNRSHFKAQEFWDTGAIIDRDMAHLRGTGWLGRQWEAQVKGNDLAHLNTNPFINLHCSPTIYDKGKFIKALNVTDINALRWYGDLDCGGSAFYDDSANRLKNNIDNQLDVLNWFQDFDSFKGYTDGSLTQQLKRAADIIASDMPFVAIHTELGGFDTHAGELERLTDLYEDLRGAISGFAKQLKQSGHWKDTLVFVYSDFGRTVGENQSGGTDHGHAGLSLLGGGDLKAFKNYRNLQEPEFEIERGEVFLKYGVDFRDLIKQVSGFVA